MWQAHNLFALSTPPWVDALHAGVDEVGIGPLAGPVLAAAVLLDTNHNIDALKDSKVLTAKRRENLAETIKSRSLCWAIGRAEVAEIDRLNILQASHLAMQRAVAQLPMAPDLVYVDGNKTPRLRMPVVAVVQGDRRVPQISAASIIAKVARDAEMQALDQQYPGYGFARHKGYPTRAHFQALQELGACAIHRRSFAPVARVL